MSFEILFVNGPNLNMLGKRDPKHYGARTLEQITDDLKLKAREHSVNLAEFQSNHEGQIIDRLHQAFFDKIDGLIINPGGLTHTSIALRDALDILTCPIVEVHLSDIKKRESFRQISMIEDVVSKSICGKGEIGYFEGLDFLIETLKE